MLWEDSVCILWYVYKLSNSLMTILRLRFSFHVISLQILQVYFTRLSDVKILKNYVLKNKQLI